jgi:hypothetical protein
MKTNDGEDSPMKNRHYFTLTITALLISQAGMGMTQTKIDDSEKLYQKAKKKSIDQKWIQSIDLFQQLIDAYPESVYRDDSHFWIGYCLGKSDDMETEAFLAFASLITRYPDSPWVDDAVIHQIALAERIVQKGNSQFLAFLVEKLESDQPSFREQAALALGRLGDQVALPVLSDMKEDEELGALADALVKKLESDPSGTLQPTKTIQKPGDLQFQEYHQLRGYDRSEWLRKYWILQDPTPTTEENEAWDEFFHRIAYARSHYSEVWNYRHFRFLRDQQLRDTWPKAPWDARGELIIKFGEPDISSTLAYHTEEWIYYNHNVDFIVKQYMTNIYGKAIKEGETSRALYRNQSAFVEANFISKEIFLFDFAHEAKPIKNIQLAIKDKPVNEGAVLAYMIPYKELKIKKETNRFSVEYLERIVIFDEDMREVYRNETLQQLAKDKKNEFKKGKTINGTIQMPLKPGAYRAALRIEDQQSKKLGIFIKTFIVRS